MITENFGFGGVLTPRRKVSIHLRGRKKTDLLAQKNVVAKVCIKLAVTGSELRDCRKVIEPASEMPA